MFKSDDQLPAEPSAFIKLNNKESLKGVFRGAPYDFMQHYYKAESKSYLCEGQGCSHCAKGNKPTFRFKINFLVLQPDGKTFVAKIIDWPRTPYRDLRAIAESHGNLDRVKVTITRNGIGLDTTYSILPMPDWKVSDALDQVLKSIPLHELSPPQPAQAQPEPGSFDDSDIPF